MPSKRIQKMDVTGLRRVFALAAKLKNPCNLSIGQPHFDVPESIQDAAVDAIRSGKNAYTSAQGIDPLREAVLKDYEKRGVPQEEALITSAVSGGLLLALIATCDVGDELIIPDPYFLTWKDLANVFGVKPVFCDTYPDFTWKREKLESCVTEKTRALILSCPSNPVGAVPTEEEFQTIAAFAKEHDLWIIYDEIYEKFHFDGPHPNMSAYYPKTITLGGFSKSHSMTGWRIGTAVGPKPIIEEMIKLQQYSFICASTTAQWAALTAMETEIEDRIDDYRKKRDWICRELAEHYEIFQPKGTFYCFIKAPEGETGSQFVERAIEKELILMPGKTFSEKDTHFRLSFANTDEQIERGLAILKTLKAER